MGRRVELIAFVRTFDATGVTELDLVRLVDVVRNERTREHAVISPVIVRAGGREFERARRELAAESALELKLSALAADHRVRRVDRLVEREVADASGVGRENPGRRVED